MIADLLQVLEIDANFSDAWYRFKALGLRQGELEKAAYAGQQFEWLRIKKIDSEAAVMEKLFLPNLGVTKHASEWAASTCAQEGFSRLETAPRFWDHSVQDIGRNPLNPRVHSQRPTHARSSGDVARGRA